MKHYCLGFVFNDEEDRVLLLRKEKPDWQKGLINGVGGKVEEGEYFADAMIREGLEEAKLKVDWTLFAMTGSTDWQMHCFRATSTLAQGKAPSENDVGEELLIFPLRSLRHLHTIPNLQWLIPMALTKPHFWPFHLMDSLPTGVAP